MREDRIIPGLPAFELLRESFMTGAELIRMVGKIKAGVKDKRGLARIKPRPISEMPALETDRKAIRAGALRE